ncbi:MAG: copper-translocating P-type ATPase [Oligoflexia bacterium]|nr:MAG: copper-translocating P-type ATPase [Oligoflexia bacterium]
MREPKQSCCHSDQIKSNALTQDLLAKENEVLTTFKVANMDCADEIKAINEALKIDGVLKVQANLVTATIQILHANKLSEYQLKKRIETTAVKILDEENSPTKNQNLNIVTASGIFLLIGLILLWAKMNSIVINICFFASIGLGGSLVFPKAWGSLRQKTFNMNVLMTIAVIGAVGIREFSEAAAVVFLFSLSELLESLSIQRARKAIQELLKITPQKADVIQSDGSTAQVDVSELQISQLIRVRAGESIPVDGLVTSGTSTVNQAPLTGESVPVLRTVGESVFAGTINHEGSLVVQVTKLFSDTKISQVIRLVEEAQSQRAISQKFVDRFAEVYTPTVMMLAMLTFLIPPLFFSGNWHDWLYKALVLLVIACPCALVISTPVSIVSSLTALARKGVLVKGGAILEVLGKIRVLAVDKTGTLTEGKPKVQKIIRFNSMSEDQILEIAMALEAHSTHPIAQAIVDLSEQKDISRKQVDKFTNISGRGVEAIIDGHSYLLGNHRFAHDVGICTPDLEKTLQDLEVQSLSIVVVGHKPHGECKGEVIGVIALGDSIRAESRQALQNLKEAGVGNVIILSGDNQKTVSAIGGELGLTEAYGDLLPEDKAKYIDHLKSKYTTVAMIGDGVNDAPAMAKSSVGIAMGFVGSDTAIETADITLMTDDLNQVAVAISAGKRTLRVIQFNIGFALLTKAIFLILTFLGYSNLWIAVAADTGATLLVIMNSLRLLNCQGEMK